MDRKAPGFGDIPDPFGQVDVDVEDRYIPPPTTGLASWERQQPGNFAQPTDFVEDDEPFTAAHLAAASQTAVPSVTRPAGPPVPLPTLDFTTSVGASGNISGKIDRPAVPSVSRIGSAPEGSRLLAAGTSSSSAPIGNTSSSPPDLPVEDPSTYAFYNIKRYRTYFNVDTDEVVARIFRAVALFFKGDFFDHIGGNPDLYGPFWIASTLVFVSAAAGNTASYIAFRRAAGGGGGGAVAPAPPSAGDHPAGWYYDVDKVGGSMGLFYGYVGVIGMALWILLRWGFKAGVTLAEVWCAYGYALATFIPIAALCVLPMEAVRWSLVSAATIASGVFLVLNFRSVVVEAAGTRAVPLLLTMACLHAGLGLALKLYFFHYSV